MLFLRRLTNTKYKGVKKNSESCSFYYSYSLRCSSGEYHPEAGAITYLMFQHNIIFFHSDQHEKQKNSLVESPNDALIWPVHLRFVLKKSIKLYSKTNLAGWRNCDHTWDRTCGPHL